MAVSKGYLARSNYRFLTPERNSPISSDTMMFELDESDIWNSGVSPAPDFYKSVQNSRSLSTKKSSNSSNRRGGGEVRVTPSSVPVNVPDWSKILKGDYMERRESYDDDFEDEEDEDDGDRIPPHEYIARQLARTRIASYSVHEGIGRTLKGRDLSRVRNAIWEKTGFQD